MEIFKALCASFFNIQYSIAKLRFALGTGEAIDFDILCAYCALVHQHIIFQD